MTLESLWQRALDRQTRGDLAGTEAFCRKILARDEAHAGAIHLLAMALAGSDRLEAALEMVEQAAAERENAHLLALSGYLLQSCGRQEDAITRYDRSLSLDRAQPDTWNNRGGALQDLGRLEEALDSFQAALARAPDHDGALFNRASAFLEMGRTRDALADFDRLVARAPGHAEAWNNRGIAQQRLERLEASLTDFGHAIALQPGHAEALYNRGVVLEELHRSEEALASLDAALAARPNYPEAWVKRGVSLQRLKRFDEALVSHAWALALRPDDPEALRHTASALCESGRVEDGFAIYMRHAALAAAPPSAAAHKCRHDAEQSAWLAQVTGRALDAGRVLHLADGGRVAGGAVNPDRDGAAARWLSARPQIVVIDDILTPEAFDKLRHFCLESTVWRKAYDGGYLGALPEHGFACPLLAQIAGELRANYPAIFADHALHYLWGFKYDGSLSGIPLHADKAAVNVNFWLTPDEANRDPDSGGLVLWDKAAPQDWDFRRYNGDTKACRDFLQRAGTKAVTVPYRANRAVIFDSDLFHQTDTIAFQDGYLNRRINVTLLYGRRTAENR